MTDAGLRLGFLVSGICFPQLEMQANASGMEFAAGSGLAAVLVARAHAPFREPGYAWSSNSRDAR